MERKKVWIYCREAYPDNMALAIQKENLTHYAETNGMDVCGITAETASGTTLSRAGFNEVDQKIRSGEIHCLVVKDISRLGRDMIQVGEYMGWLKNNGVELICMDGSHHESDSMKQLRGFVRTAIFQSAWQKKMEKR